MTQKSKMTKSGLTIFARGVLYLVGLASLAVCFILLPEIAREESVSKPTNHFMTYSFLGGAYILATPFFVALFQTHRLLKYIDHNKFFSIKSLEALQKIKVCALIFSALIVISVIAGMIMARSVNPVEDVTFMIPLGIIFTLVPCVIAVFVAVMQKLLAEVVALKSENDLIV